MLPPLDNYLSFGADVIAGNQKYKDLFFDFFFTVFQVKRLGVQDMISACKLIEAILLNLPGQVDAYLYRVLDTVRPRLEDAEEYKKPVFKVFLLEVVINAIYYNPVATLQYLEHCNFLSKFLELWFKESDCFLRVHDKTLSILALMKIVQLPPEHVPASFQSNGALQFLMKGLLTFFRTLPDAAKRTLPNIWCLLPGRTEANDLVEEDGDSVAAEGEEEWNEEDSWSDAEDNGDVADEAQEYLDFLAQQVVSF
jgi:importin-7